ncbi:MAG TPA: hypothetical protein VJ861_05060 [Treponemataceae bacterium]|nr:hypothetical protein [Treponemataceae bacterium]
MRKLKWYAVCFFIIVLFFPCIASESEESWRVLSQAWIAFEHNNPGEALHLCEKARQIHRDKNQFMRNELANSLIPMQVKKEKDDLSAIRSVLLERNDVTAITILDSIFLTNPPSSFSNSMSAVLKWLEIRGVYPEADYLTGRIYELEGEVSLALNYYQKALNNYEVMDIPEERFTILYRMADLSQFSGNTGLMENYLLRIVSEDSVYSQTKPLTPMLSAMLRTLDTEKTSDKFFLLYRHNYLKGLLAYQMLATYYYNKNDFDNRALAASALSSIISVTQLSAALNEYDFSWEYSSLKDLFTRIGKNSELKEWARSAGVWDSFLLFGKILIRSDMREQGRHVWSVIAAYCPEKDIALEASTLLSKD